MKILTCEDSNNWRTIQICSGRGLGRPGIGCGAVLEIEEEDISVMTRTRGYDKEWFYTAKCIRCGEIVDIPSVIIPSEVKSQILKRYYEEQK